MDNEEHPVVEPTPPPENKRVWEPSQFQTAQQIADRLGEKQADARTQLLRIVQALGRTQANALLAETLRIEEQGGLPVLNGSRRRSPGGVFFHLASTTGTTKSGEPLSMLVPRERPTKAATGKQEATQKREPVQPPTPPFRWEDRKAVIETIGTAKGKVMTVKITLIGQLGSVADKGTCMVGVMEHTGEKFPALPKGVPTPQAIPTTYVVSIATKQWKQVAAAATDPEDAFIIEGFPQLDAATGSLAVFAVSITSKKLQAAKKQPRQEG